MDKFDLKLMRHVKKHGVDVHENYSFGRHCIRSPFEYKGRQSNKGDILIFFTVTSNRNKIEVFMSMKKLPELVKCEVHHESRSESQNPNLWIQHAQSILTLSHACKLFDPLYSHLIRH